MAAYVYVLGSVTRGVRRTYVGWTTDLDQRVARHNAGTGAKSTRGRVWFLLYAERYATEKQQPMSQRELELALRYRQIDPLPPEVLEAGAWPVIDYENPLADMARAQVTAKTMRWVEGLVQLANVKPEVMDRVDADAVAIGSAEEIGVNPKYINDDATVAALRKGRADAQSTPVDAEALAKGAGATLDLAKARQIAEAA